MFFDPTPANCYAPEPNPLTPDEIPRLRTARPAERPPQPSTDQRRASATGVVMVAWQKIALGRVHAGKTVTIHVKSTTST
jgi:hypothetical protein